MSFVAGIKKGIVEVADMIVVTKSDGNLVTAAKIIEAEYRSATRFIQPKNSFWHTKVNFCSVFSRPDAFVSGMEDDA